MPKFSYYVKDIKGRAFKNVAEAYNKKSLIDKLQQQGYFIISVENISVPEIKKKTPANNPTTAAAPPTQRRKASSSSKNVQLNKKYHHKKAKLQDLVTFARQMSTMLEAGVSMVRSLEVIQDQAQSEVLAKALYQIQKDVEHGISLSVALGKHPKIFDQFWVSLTEVGEASGTIAVVLTKLSFYLEQQESFRSNIISGIIYPVILFFISMGAVAFFALFVGPRFQSIFESMDAQLPLITEVLMDFFDFVREKFWFIVAGIFIAFRLFKMYIKTYTGKIMWEKFLFSLPQAGEVFRLITVERFASQMAILIEAGVPILYALDISERLVDNNTCAIVINKIKDSVKRGELLAEPMQRSKFFPAMAIQMIRAGEETGELGKMLKHVSVYYQGIVETFMKRFGTVVEPFMLVFMGAIIGTIVVAMFLPMFNMAQLG